MRRDLVIAPPGRAEAREVAEQFCTALAKHGLGVRLLTGEASDLQLDIEDLEVVAADGRASAGCELTVVIGGDGTILRAAELTHDTGTPLLGVNLGHVGFLAESESDDVDFTIDAVVGRRYVAEERLTLDVTVYRDKELVASTWALNEASVEKAARERMIEVVVEVDGRPLSRWAGDGVVCATPTGSTAYSFSAGGPIVWPGVEALLMVPISAHALFARPLVVDPKATIAVEVIGGAAAMLSCDGRRTFDLPERARVEVRRGHRPVRLARIEEGGFTDRLVRKFELPVAGWRGRRQRRG